MANLSQLAILLCFAICLASSRNLNKQSWRKNSSGRKHPIGRLCYPQQGEHFTIYATFENDIFTNLTNPNTTIQVRHADILWREYGRCISEGKSSNGHIVSCKIPKRNYKLTSIHRITMKEVRNGTLSRMRYPFKITSYSCLDPADKKSELNILPVQDNSTTQSPKNRILVQWTRLNTTNPNRTSLFINGIQNTNLECACPNKGSCKNTSTNQNCSIYMVGFSHCTNYRICVETTSATRKIQYCAQYKTLCTSYQNGNGQMEGVATNSTTVILIVLIVLVALILLMIIFADRIW
uniref:Cnidarian restricted protein n=1 Tax=Clytia hemisphaerica TaxID=252671 RepID=A0A7M5V496_9CNID|eukprot:TCONS_00030304-protein